EAFFLGGVAEGVGNAGGDDGRGAGGVAVMKKERSGRKADNAEDAVEGLGEHALDFAADETGGREIEIGEGEHVSLDAAFFFLVDGHDEEHADESDGHGGDGEDGVTEKPLRGLQEKESENEDAPGGKRHTEQTVGEGFVVAAFVPEEIADGDVDEGRGNERGELEDLKGVGRGPKSEKYCSAD